MTGASRRLDEAISEVVKNGNCTGCGLCSSLFEGVGMALTNSGFMRPVVGGRSASSDELAAVKSFKRVCPGRGLTAPASEVGAETDEVFGRFLGVWEGWASDSVFRNAGSSGGVLTAVASFVSTTSGLPAQMVGMDHVTPRRSVPVRIMSKEEALQSAGSRYAPVAAAAESTTGTSSVTGKPCEIAALRSVSAVGENEPLLLSFFCAGTPSQFATDELIKNLGHDPERINHLSYRGNGWPGDFKVTSEGRPDARKSYEDSWGQILGKQLQNRCKICVDGTGEFADISVGDYWLADESGYPIFDDHEGKSVVIARTYRGKRVLQECVAAGVIELAPISLASVAIVQPLQVKRRRTLPGRLLGQYLAGRKVPLYFGYALVRRFLRRPLSNLRAAFGTFRRGLGQGERQG